MFKRIDHVEIIPCDFDKAMAFYTEVLGFTVRQRMAVDAQPLEEIAYLALGDTVLELMRVKDAASAQRQPWQTGYRMMAIEIEDMDQAVTYLAGKGVPVTWGPVTMGTTKRAEIHDLDGNPIELRQW
ncbi:lactoylglutathione lyase [Geobacter pickeringii]|uniref:Lactoylglutathione lyase n=2 Tax=Geobacter pickeringii TaxID=345632 RepID=A0A0B5BES3_9BACT|nr:lactoylglutathione lyase [Geobacter pickeringii]